MAWFRLRSRAPPNGGGSHAPIQARLTCDRNRPRARGYPGCSVRIPRDTAKNGKGYIEDRRPASNIDPYLVSAKIAETVLLKDFGQHNITFENAV